MAKIVIRVEYFNNTRRWYPVKEDKGWRVDAADRVLLINVPSVERDIIPLDNVVSFHIEERDYNSPVAQSP